MQTYQTKFGPFALRGRKICRCRCSTHFFQRITLGPFGSLRGLAFGLRLHLFGAAAEEREVDIAARVLFQIGQQLGLPILFVGTGERYEDIHPFDKDEFLDALVGMED